MEVKEIIETLFAEREKMLKEIPNAMEEEKKYSLKDNPAEYILHQGMVSKLIGKCEGIGIAIEILRKEM